MKHFLLHMKYRSLSMLNHNDTSSVKFFFPDRYIPRKMEIKYHIYKELRSRYRLKMQNLTSYVFPKMNIAIQVEEPNSFLKDAEIHCHSSLACCIGWSIRGWSLWCPLSPPRCLPWFLLLILNSLPTTPWTWMQDSRISYQFITIASSWANCLISFGIYTIRLWTKYRPSKQ